MNKNVFIFVALIIASTSAQTTITPGVTFTSTTSFRAWSYFSLKLSESTINYVKLVTTVSSGTPFYYANIGSLPTFQNNTWIYENTTAGPLTKYFYNPNVDRNTGNFNNAILYLAVYGYTNTKYTFVVYTQGPITIYDRQVYSPSFPVPSVYLFFNFQVDSMLRRLQIVTADNLSIANFYASNSTNNYPVYGGTYQYSSKYYNTLKTSCVFTDYPYSGNYRLGVYGNIVSYNFTLQFVENGVQSCST